MLFPTQSKYYKYIHIRRSLFQSTIWFFKGNTHKIVIKLYLTAIISLRQNASPYLYFRKTTYLYDIIIYLVDLESIIKIIYDEYCYIIVLKAKLLSLCAHNS